MQVKCPNFLQKVQSSRSNDIYLVSGTYEDKAAWYYILVDRMKRPIFERLCDAGSNIDLEEYGIVLKTGWGASPPQYIKDKIDNEGADYDDSEFHTIENHEDMKYYVQSQDEQGKSYFAYLLVPGIKAEEFLIVSNNGGCDMSDYGVIVESGWGRPSSELRQKMENLGFEHPQEEAV